MKHLTVIATIQAKPESISKLKAELLNLIAPTRDEAGCINYDLHQDNEDPATFVFYENWSSSSDLDAHLQSAHIQNYLAKADALLEGWSLRKLTRIG